MDVFQSWLVRFLQHCEPQPRAIIQTRLTLQMLMQTEIEAVGPWGPVIFVVSVAAGEMIPLLPTQPLAIAGGLLFGAVRVRHLPSGLFHASMCKA